MNDLERLSNEELRRLLDEAQAQIAEVRAELEQRELKEQHAAIDTLEVQLERAQVNWSELKQFFQQVLAELRGRTK